MFKHILIPTDGSTIALKAAKAGIRFAAETGARVTAFHAIDQWQPAYISPDMATSRTFVDFERLARERGAAGDGAGWKIAESDGGAFTSRVSYVRPPTEG